MFIQIIQLLLKTFRLRVYFPCKYCALGVLSERILNNLYIISFVASITFKYR